MWRTRSDRPLLGLRLRPGPALRIGLAIAALAACGSSEGQLPWPASADAGAEAATRPCTVARVIDGDTIECAGGERVRLLLIDAPERAQAPFADRATAALRALLDGAAEVGLEMDVQPRDRYGRTLAYLWRADGRMVNEEMARAGFVVPLTYPPNVRHVKRIRAAVAEARAAGRGLWATPAFACPPVESRRGRC